MAPILYDCIDTVVCTNNALNPSFHMALKVLFNQNVNKIIVSDRFIEKKTISWHRVQELEVNQYRENVHGKLNGLQVPYDAIRCNYVNCINDSHRHKLSKYCENIINLCVKVGDECFSKVKNKIRQILYWNEIVKPLKDDAIFGTVFGFHVHHIMKHIKHQYHYTIRAIKKRDVDLRKSRMAECLTTAKNHRFKKSSVMWPK